MSIQWWEYHVFWHVRCSKLDLTIVSVWCSYFQCLSPHPSFLNSHTTNPWDNSPSQSQVVLECTFQSAWKALSSIGGHWAAETSKWSWVSMFRSGECLRRESVMDIGASTRVHAPREMNLVATNPERISEFEIHRILRGTVHTLKRTSRDSTLWKV